MSNHRYDQKVAQRWRADSRLERAREMTAQVKGRVSVSKGCLFEAITSDIECQAGQAGSRAPRGLAADMPANGAASAKLSQQCKISPYFTTLHCTRTDHELVMISERMFDGTGQNLVSGLVASPAATKRSDFTCLQYEYCETYI